MVGAKVFQRPKDDPAIEKFLDYFYKHCVEVLFKPFFDIPEFSRMTGLSILFYFSFRYLSQTFQ